MLKAPEPDAIAQPGTVTTAPSGLSPGPYALTTDEGAVITFDLPTVPAPDDDVEQLRRDLSVEPVVYVELHIDNTEGTRTVQIDDLKVISHEGGQFPFEPVAEVLSDWDPNRSGEGGFWGADGSPLDPQEGARLDARTHELIAQYTGAVPVGATGRELMVGDFEKLPKTFDDIELSPYPNDRSQDPAPVGHGPEQRQYRAGVPKPAPRERIEAEPAPAPAAPEPARPAAQPPRVPAAPVPAEPAPAPEPEPAAPQPPVEPANPQQPVDPVIPPVVPPVMPPAEPTPEPTPTPVPPVAPPPEETMPPAENPDRGEVATPGATAGASASPSPSTSRRWNWPPRPESTPTPAPSASTTTPSPAPSPTATPTPTASTGAPSPAATPGPSPSLPSGAELA
ncbi:hypothetical protein [Kocuria rosea]|uniref:hypothetical protein n=1 Tax=Kocuria rosea TaxID=1275 RepID=UPI0011A28CD3|nr:hypothetical protein [Kocuria rosea]MCM3485221.1 hypothetical protein [Kocuria rosea]WJZ67989.1 hypothetical protein QR564_07875 [Kocuria rosea]